jgi:DNA invertase Pin-like site-specific DNA recombinase
MRRPIPQTVSLPIPVAQYVRMSDEQQQYSIDNQKAAIKEYADSHGFAIVKTYDDLGKSGVVAKHRLGLHELLKDVVNGKAEYKAVLVYDVSRWGRFPNSDEAAHYEFLCSSSGIPLHYCAEPFANDGTATSTLLKALKRSMAAEFSRELGEKEFRGKSRIVQLGFWVGGVPGYGYRRRMVSPEGKLKQVMKPGEQKSLKTDRVILVLGPRREIECVRHMFSMALEGSNCNAIARDLNRSGVTHEGRSWSRRCVANILRNPKYAGCNVWHRSSKRLRDRRTLIDTQGWIMKPGAFAPIVDRETFDRAQAALPRAADYLWSDDAILRRVRRLLKVKGHLSSTILQNARGTPSLATIHKRFGTYRQLYKQVGYHLPADQEFMSEQLKRSLCLRQDLIAGIKGLFPGSVVVTCCPDGRRSMLLIDSRFLVSVLLCRSRSRRGRLFWVVEPLPDESEYVTLLCPMNPTHDRVLDYFVFPRLKEFKSHYLVQNDPFLHAAIRLDDLSNFYVTVNRIWAEHHASVVVNPRSESAKSGTDGV